MEKLDSHGGDYYVIEHGNKKSKNYFPADKNKSIRSISSQAVFEETIKYLKKKKSETKFDSKKDRQQFFESKIDESDLHVIVTTLKELICVEGLAVREQKVIDKLIATLELEASIIYDKTKAESKKIISKYLS